MPVTLPIIRARARLLLEDSNALNYSDDALDEAVRQALADYCTAAGETITVSGLDGAAATTLPAADEALLVGGVSAYAVFAKAAGRALQYDLNQQVDDTLFAWAKIALQRYRDNLRGVKRRLLRTAAAPPYAPLEDESNQAGGL